MSRWLLDGERREAPHGEVTTEGVAVDGSALDTVNPARFRAADIQFRTVCWATGVLSRRSLGDIPGHAGALTEAMSDIMDVDVESHANQKNSAVKFDWTVGEDAFTPKFGVK